VIIGSGLENLTPEQQAIADRVCIRAFFADVREACATQGIVLMLDAYEKCENELKKWIVEYLLERCFFDHEKRPAQLVLVVAGRDIPEFEKRWAPEDIEAVVGSVRQLGKWEKKHIEECLRAHGFNYTAQQVDTFYNLIEMGIPPSQVVQAVETAVAAQRRPS
jgi:hypothetical protein